MKKTRILTLFMGLAAVLSLWGCGSDNREESNDTPRQVAASQACIGCHNQNISSVSGGNVYNEWQRSAHSTADGGPGCDDCHHVDGHPQNGSIPPLPNTQTCVQCHTATITMRTQQAHFRNVSASYMAVGVNQFTRIFANPVMPRSAAGCNGCHNPHDVTTLLPVNSQWAQSGHGDINSESYNEARFIGRNPCNRCHSATGYRYYMTSRQTILAKTLLGTYTTAKEVIACNACHTDYSWNRISTDTRPATTSFTPPTFVTFSTPYQRFPNVKKNFPSGLRDTNLCIGCHGGRESRSGASLTLTSPAPAGFTLSPDPHYFQAAATMYMKIGFINFTSQSTPIGTSTYGQSLISSEDITGGVTSFHRRLGTPAINGFNANLTPGVLDQKGPCVTCHMATGPTAGHTWKITADTWNAVCSKCHPSELGVPLTATNFEQAFLEPNREVYFNALSLAVRLLEQRYGLTVVFDDEGERDPNQGTPELARVVTTTGASITWGSSLAVPGFPTVSGPTLLKLKGAVYNILLGYKEPAGFLHARTYMRRLIYDSIDWLDDNTLNRTVGQTALGPVGRLVLVNGSPAYGYGATAFTDATLSALAPGTTESMTYLLNFSRATGAWGVPERP